MKTCFKCGERKPLSEFYRHKMMADGHLGKCKECTKLDTREWYHRTHDQRCEYEQKRSKTKHRKSRSSVYLRHRRRADPVWGKAHAKVHRALRNGTLTRQPCELCGDPKSQAHHDDYSKPLDVRWLCFRCHRVHAHGQVVANVNANKDTA